MSDITYKYLTKESEVQQLYKLMSMEEIHRWTGVPLFPPMIREAAKKRQIIVAMNEDNLIGFILFNKNKAGYNVIHYHIVHPDFQRHGIASKLVSFVPRPCMAKCKIDNKKIQSLYVKIGMHMDKIETRISSRGRVKHQYKVAVYCDDKKEGIIRFNK